MRDTHQALTSASNDPVRVLLIQATGWSTIANGNPAGTQKAQSVYGVKTRSGQRAERKTEEDIASLWQPNSDYLIRSNADLGGGSGCPHPLTNVLSVTS